MSTLTRTPYLSGLLGLLCLASLSACQQDVSGTANNLEYPLGAHVACRDALGAFREGAGCLESGGTFWALVLDGGLAELKVVDLGAGRMLDHQPAVPGYNGWSVGGVPRATVALPDTSQAVVGVATPDRLLRLDFQGTPEVAFDLPAPPRDLAWVDTAEGSFLVVALDGMARLALHDPETLAPVDVIDLPRFPDQLAVSPAPGVVAWTARGAARVGWTDLSMRDLHEIAFRPACSDGVDDDGDGLVDAADPACQHPWQASEVEDAGDDDFAPGACANGLDDDADGLADEADPGCGGRNGDAEDADERLCAPGAQGGLRCGTLLHTFACADGVDNDGDGRTDFGADADCRSPLQDHETPAYLAAAGLAFLPDGMRLVVGDARGAALHLLDLETDSPIEPTGRPLLQRYERARGVPLSGGVVDVAVADATDEGVPVYALGADGLVYRLRAEEGDAGWALRLLEVDEPLDATITKPRLQDGDANVEVGITSPWAYPGFGVMEVVEREGAPTIYYGIEPSAERADLRSELWTLAYEGELPGSRSQRAVVDPATGDLIDPGADFCELGVEPGDRLVLTFPDVEPDCAAVAGVEWSAILTEVARDRLRLDPASLAPPEDAGLAADLRPTGACGPTGAFYRVHATGAFLAVGSRTGLLHNQQSRQGRCVTRTDADDRFRARALVAEPLEPAIELTECPEIGDDAHFSAVPFQNPSFSLTLYPGCERLESLLYRPIPAQGELRWSFRVTGGEQPRWFATGGLPVSLTWIADLSSLLFADPARGNVYLFEESEEGALPGDVYY